MSIHTITQTTEHNPTCYFKLLEALKTETGFFFPICLKYITYLDDNVYYNNYFNSSIVHTKADACICGVKIKSEYYFKYEYNGVTKILIIGSTCFKHLLNDLRSIKNIEIYNHWRDQVQYAINDTILRHNKNIKCVNCKVPWCISKKFRRGLCPECCEILSDLGKIKMRLPKFKGKTFNTVYKSDEGYIRFCIMDKTRQFEMMREYILLKDKLL